MDVASFISPVICFLKHYLCHLWIPPATAYLHTPKATYCSFPMTSCPAGNCIPCIPQSNCTLCEKVFPFRSLNLSSFWIPLLPKHSVRMQPVLYKHGTPCQALNVSNPSLPIPLPEDLLRTTITAVSLLWRQPGFCLIFWRWGNPQCACMSPCFLSACSLQIPTSGSSLLLYPQLYSKLPIETPRSLSQIHTALLHMPTASPLYITVGIEFRPDVIVAALFTSHATLLTG